MKSNITDLTLVIDRSGSMQQRREDAEGGVNAFAEAGAMGMKPGAVADYAMHKVGMAYEMTSKKISPMWSQHRKGEEVLDEFTDEERKKVM